MNVDQFNDAELLAFVVLAKHMVHADGDLSQTEMLDLMSVGEVVGMDRFSWALDQTKDLYRDRQATYNVAARVQRYDAKVLIFVLLEELAKGDGVDGQEATILADLRQGWQI